MDQKQAKEPIETYGQTPASMVLGATSISI